MIEQLHPFRFGNKPDDDVELMTPRDKPRMVPLTRDGLVRGDAGLVKRLLPDHEYAMDRDVCVRCGRTAVDIIEHELRCEVQHD